MIVDILFFLLIIALNSWLFFYSCLKKKKIALYILLISLVFVLAIWGYSIGTVYMFYLTPLVVWLIFACMLNFTEINNE
jgi:tryptophan-rich sensory protein